ncbi:hypothetical protein [Variovorax paradoxus]|nr:hypothetical protein [Variovorax paradoxus]
MNFQIAGPSTQLHDIQQKREAAFATQTLGGPVTALNGTYLSPHPSPNG